MELNKSLNYDFLKEIFCRSKLLQKIYWKNNSFVRRFRKIFFRFVKKEDKFCIEFSNICNASCIFCSYPLIKKSGKTMTNMDEEIFTKALQFIKKSGYKYISLTPITGETFVNKNWHEYLSSILKIDTIKKVDIYSNALLLNSENIKKILNLENAEKVNFNFSVGGIDAATYKMMFGIDEFFTVKKNINEFLEKLKDPNRKVFVSIEIRIPKDSRISIKKASEIYNPLSYKYAAIKIRDTFDPIHNLIEYKDALKFFEIEKRDYRPCQHLTDLACRANGEVWLCGCVASELPNNISLEIGNIDDLIEKLMKNKDTVIKNWKIKNEIPLPCQDCTFYISCK